MVTDDSATVSATDRKQPRSIAAMLRSQMRNIAPFLTLIFLSGFFALASPSFATLDNVGNILTQVSVTGIIAVGLTFVILCAEIDLSIASIANVTGIAVAYFTLQESYVNIANIPLPGWAAILLALALCAMLGVVNALGLTIIGIPSFIMTLAMMQIAAGISALLVRGQIAYKVPGIVATLGSSSIGGIPWIVIVAALMLLAGHIVLDLHALRPLRVHGRRQSRGGRIFRAQRQPDPRQRHGDLSGVFGDRRHAGRGAFRQRAAERVRYLPARLRSPPSWSAAPACSADAAASATPSSDCSCWASSTTASTTSISTVS